MANRSWGVGMISTGWVAGAHVEALKAVAGVNITAVCSRRLQRAQEFILTHNLVQARAYDSVSDMLADDSVDVVVVASPHPLHPTQTIAAAKAGKHVIIEKPVALTPQDLAAMLAAVRKAKVQTSVCFELHWNGLFRNIRAMLDQKLIGNLYYGECAYNHGIGPWYGQWQWNTKRRMAGSAILTAGCHALDGLIWFMDSRVTEVAAMSNTSPQNPLKYEYDPNSIALLRFENGAIGTVQTSIECRMPYTFPIRLQGDKGAIHNDQVSLVAWPATRGWAKIPAALPDSGDVHDHPYVGQFQHFFDCLNKGQRPENDLGACAHTHEVCFAIQDAIRARKTVKVRRTSGA